MELSHKTIDRDATLATEIARALWSGEEDSAYQGGLSIDERLQALREDLASDLRRLAETDGELRELYAARIAETKAEIAEITVEIAERAAICDGIRAAAAKRPKPPTERQAAGRATASNVCAIANKITRSVPRKEAFAAAWQIAKRGYYEIAIVGVSFGSRQEALRRLAGYDPESIIAVLVPEPDCAHDPDAIAVKVMVKGGKGIYTLGYVPRAETAIARAFLGRPPRLELVGGETKGARIRLAA